MLELREGDFEFVDNADAKRVGHQKLVPHAASPEETGGLSGETLHGLLVEPLGRRKRRVDADAMYASQ